MTAKTKKILTRLTEDQHVEMRTMLVKLSALVGYQVSQQLLVESFLDRCSGDLDFAMESLEKANV